MYGHNFVFLKEIAWMSGCCHFLHPVQDVRGWRNCQRSRACVWWCMCEGWACGVRVGKARIRPRARVGVCFLLSFPFFFPPFPFFFLSLLTTPNFSLTSPLLFCLPFSHLLFFSLPHTSFVCTIMEFLEVF